MAAFYFSVGISANIFGAAITDWYAAGPEPVIFGQLGGFIAAYIFYWDYIQCACCFKMCGCFGLVFLILACSYIFVAIAQPLRDSTQAIKIAYPDS